MNKGYISLISTLIVLTVVVSVSLMLLTFSITNLKTSQSVISSFKAKNLASACAELALLELHNNQRFEDSTNSVAIDSESCNYEIIGATPFRGEIRAYAIVEDITKKILLDVNISNQDSIISVTSWNEVDDFN